MSYSNKKKITSFVGVLFCSLMILSVSFQSFLVLGKEESANDNSASMIDTVRSKATFFVGGTGAGNYTTIQEAIDNASSGDTVHVFPGTYHENIIIEKDLIIIGDQKETTIIDGDNLDNTVTIGSFEVVLESFTIQNGYYYGIFLDNCYNKIFYKIL